MMPAYDYMAIAVLIARAGIGILMLHLLSLENVITKSKSSALMWGTLVSYSWGLMIDADRMNAGVRPVAT